MSEDTDKIIRISESYIIGFDIMDDDESSLTVATSNGKELTFIKHITGKEVKELYEKLIAAESERRN